MSTLDSPTFEPQKPVSKWPVALRWGVIGGLAGIALQMIWHLAGWSDYTSSFSAGNLALMPLSWAVSIGAIAMGIKQYRDEHQGGYATFGSAFGTGILVALVMAAISALFVAFYLGGIMTESITENMYQQFESQGLDDEQIEQAAKMAGIFTSTPVLAIFGFFGAMIGGVILSLIGAAIMKKDPPMGV